MGIELCIIYDSIPKPNLHSVELRTNVLEIIEGWE